MKSCFVVCPIGDDDSETRKRSDTVMNRIIKPVVKELGYKATRADEISEPGMITSQIVERLFNDDLVIADLTDGNPNVYYELAVRHIVKKPVVHIILSGQKPHFDVSGERMIRFDTRDIDIYEESKIELKAQIEAVEKDPLKIDSPISQAIDIKGLFQSDNPLEKNIARILEILLDIKFDIATRNDPYPGGFISSSLPEDEAAIIKRMVESLKKIPPKKDPTGKPLIGSSYEELKQRMDATFANQKGTGTQKPK